MWGTCCKCSSETTCRFARHELLQGWLRFPCHSICENVDLILTILLKYNFSGIPFPGSLKCKNLNVN